MLRRALPAAAAILCLSAAAQTSENGAAGIGGYAVDIKGAGAATALLNDHLDIKRHEKKTDLSREEFERLAAAAPRQIRELLATEGYFSPRIEPQTVREGGRWIARFHIVPGPATLVTEVGIRFAGAVASGPHADPARIAELRRQWPLKQGRRFRQADWDEAKAVLLKPLLNRDYPAARIADSRAAIDPDKRSAALEVEVDSGPRFTFGRLRIQGLNRYSPDMIEALNPIRPGEPFAQEKLTELQARLQDSGYFNTVFATIEVDAEHPDEVPVRVDVTENKRRKLSLGVGFSTDSGAHAETKWLDRHFLGRNWRLDSLLRVDRQAQLLGADLLFPVRDEGWRPSLGAHVERTDIANEINDKIRFDARMTSALKRDERAWGASFLAEKQRIADGARTSRRALVATYVYTRRRVDNLLAPTRGYVASIELNAGARGLLSDANIGRLVLRGNWLSPTVGGLQAVARFDIGRVIGADRSEVPSDLLFRTGGDRSVRGYAYNSLGVEQDGAIVGGRAMAAFSAELVYYFRPRWGAAVFRDAGNAADSWRGFRLRQSTGVGARWRSPIGPVGADLAFAHATREPRIHFSIGYGF
ncbi:MAG TPA: autotransporter assembly complex family protein [Paucimonas sp.]|nr:autotransporter assembly complex family protein [Paucimonas sp.]